MDVIFFYQDVPEQEAKGTELCKGHTKPNLSHPGFNQIFVFSNPTEALDNTDSGQKCRCLLNI